MHYSGSRRKPAVFPAIFKKIKHLKSLPIYSNILSLHSKITSGLGLATFPGIKGARPLHLHLESLLGMGTVFGKVSSGFIQPNRIQDPFPVARFLHFRLYFMKESFNQIFSRWYRIL